MRLNAGRTGGGRAFTLPVLMAAVFTVSVGYGVVLPRLPRLIERLLGPGVEAAQVSWHTGLLTAVYTAAYALCRGFLHPRHAGRIGCHSAAATALLRNTAGSQIFCIGA